MLQTITFLTCCGECPHNNKHHGYIFSSLLFVPSLSLCRFSWDTEPQKFDNFKNIKSKVYRLFEILQWYDLQMNYVIMWINEFIRDFRVIYHIKNEDQSKEKNENESLTELSHLQNCGSTPFFIELVVHIFCYIWPLNMDVRPNG